MQADNNIPPPNADAVPIERIPSIQEDPFGISYPDSAIQYLPYRIGIVVFAVLMIFLGKSNLPSDEVSCIEDVVLNGLQPVTNFYINNPGLGLTLISIAQLIVDIQLIAMLGYWFWQGTTMRYPLVLAIIGISKVLLNVLFQTKPIENAFTDQAFFSFIFGSNFVNTYFFSGVMCLAILHWLEYYELGHKKLFWIQLGINIYLIFVLFTMRQNFFMDIFTAIVFTHYVFYFINDRIVKIDQFIFKIYDKITGNAENEVKSRKQLYQQKRSGKSI